MKNLLFGSILASLLAGCATPVLIDNESRGRTMVPCLNDTLCIRDTYSVVWDNDNNRNYPVSYRAKQTEYILVPGKSIKSIGEYGGGK